MTYLSQVKYIIFIPTHFGRKWKTKTIKRSRDETKQRFWLQFGGLIMKFKGFTRISPSYSLFSSYTSGWHEMKASIKRANRRRWVDVVAWSWSVCFGLLCACLHCMCAYGCVFECLCVCFESSLAPISVFSVQRLPPPYCCRISVQEGSPVGPEKWACTSISLAATALEVLLFKTRMFSWLVKQESLLLFELTTWQAVIFHQCCITRASINWDKRM